MPSLSGVASPGLGKWVLIDCCLIPSSHPSGPWPPCLSQAWACPQQAQSGGFYLIVLNGCLYQEPFSLAMHDTQQMERGPREAPAMLLSGSGATSPGARLGSRQFVVVQRGWVLCPFLQEAARARGASGSHSCSKSGATGGPGLHPIPPVVGTWASHPRPRCVPRSGQDSTTLGKTETTSCSSSSGEGGCWPRMDSTVSYRGAQLDKPEQAPGSERTVPGLSVAPAA